MYWNRWIQTAIGIFSVGENQRKRVKRRIPSHINWSSTAWTININFTTRDQNPLNKIIAKASFAISNGEGLDIAIFYINFCFLGKKKTLEKLIPRMSLKYSYEAFTLHVRWHGILNNGKFIIRLEGSQLRNSFSQNIPFVWTNTKHRSWNEEFRKTR